jgi:hypothetical protein
MARGVNKVILVGTCGQDPEVRYLPNGHAVTTLKASCRLASGKKTASSVTPLKSLWTCRAPCNCWVAVHRATMLSKAKAVVVIRTPRLVHSNRVLRLLLSHSASRVPLRNRRHNRPLISTASMTISRSDPI